jgi:arylsulfatase A-like enzyme
MAVVTGEWKYIYWYYAADGMQPTEELFHVGQDPYEMKSLANDPKFLSDLVTMRWFYDIELATIRAKAVKGHGHEPYSVLFSRTIAWEQKEPLLNATKVGGSGWNEGDGAKQGKKGKAAKKQS